MNNKNEFMRKIYNHCKANGLELKIEKSHIDLGYHIDNIIVENAKDMALWNQVESYLIQAETHRLLVCYFCPKTIYVILNNSQLYCPYTAPYKFIEKWFNEQTEVECIICYEKKDEFYCCGSCLNRLCRVCFIKLTNCPLCRAKLNFV